MRGPLDLVEIFGAEVRGIERRRHELGIAGDDGQQVVEVVRDAAGEPADRLHLHRLRELFLGGFQLLLCSDDVGHVARIDDGVRLALGRVVALRHRFQAAPVPVLVPEPVAHRADHRVGSEQLIELLLNPADVFRVHQIEVVAADKLARVVAKLRLHRLALVDRDAVRTDERDHVRRVLDERLVQLRDPALVGLPLLLRGDVERDADQPPAAIRRRPHRDDVAQPHDPAVGGMHPVFELVVLSPARRLTTEPRAAVDVVRMRVAHPEVRVVQPVAHRIAEDPFGLRADEGEMERLGLGFPDDGAKAVDQ